MAKTDTTKLSDKIATRILVVDDHPLVREGLVSRISRQSDLEVCGEADCVADALAQVQATNPDLVIIDIQLSGGNGIELINEIRDRFGETKMLVVSAFDESLYAERSLRAGALGYINKRELQDNVIDAIRTVRAGERYLSSKMTRKLVGQAIGQKELTEGDSVERLSDRELEVFQLIGRGKTTRAIAAQLVLSVHTIDTHREKIRHKLGIRNGAELMQRAVQWVLENG